MSNILFSCNDITWIRSLPKETHQISQGIKIPMGTYVRPSNVRSAMGAKDHYLEISEKIEMTEKKDFQKIYVKRERKENKQFYTIITGRGTYEQRGVWILFSTESLLEKSCEVVLSEKNKFEFKVDPCPEIVETEKQMLHKLTYHFDPKDLSLAQLQYESGYKEAKFGIAWEVTSPFEENKMFKIIRAKYTKKEFQPHVFYYERLD